MTIETAAAFALGMFLLCLSPGPGVATVVARALGSGAPAGFATILGITIGDILFMTLAFFGLTAVAAAAGPVFAIVKYAGAAYLIYLGVKNLRAAYAGGGAMEVEAVRRRGLWRDTASGLVVTLGNPKPILFFGALMPTFLDMDEARISDLALMAGIVACATFGVLGAYALLAARSRRAFRSPAVLKRLKLATGVVFIAAGVFAATR